MLWGPIADERRGRILETNEALASQALRTLGVAGRWLTGETLAEQSAHPDGRLEQDLTFAGLIGIIDPPRPEARDAVVRARHAGIRPMVITGDLFLPFGGSCCTGEHGGHSTPITLRSTRYPRDGSHAQMHFDIGHPGWPAVGGS